MLAVLEAVVQGGQPSRLPGEYGAAMILPNAPVPEPDCAKRFYGTCGGWYLGGSPDAIVFEVEDPVCISGIFMCAATTPVLDANLLSMSQCDPHGCFDRYGDNKNSSFTMKVAIYEGMTSRGTECLYGPEEHEYNGDGPNMVEVDLHGEVPVEVLATIKPSPASTTGARTGSAMLLTLPPAWSLRPGSSIALCAILQGPSPTTATTAETPLSLRPASPR